MTNLFTFNGLEGQKGTISRVCLGFVSVLSRLSLGFLSVKSWRICAVLVMLLSLGVGNVLGATVTINKDDSWDHGGSSGGSGGQVDIVKSGMTVSTAGGYVDAGKHIRVYNGKELTISSTVGNITKIEFTSTASGTSTNGPSKIGLKGGQNGSYSYSGSKGTWTYASGSSSVIFATNAQFRFTQVVITYAASTVSKASITGLDYNYGSGPSAAQSFTVSGTNVTGNLTVTAPTNFEVSKSSGDGYGSSVTLSPTSGTVSSTTIYVRLASGKAVGSYGSASTYVTVTGGGTTTKNVSVSGTVSSACSNSVAPSKGTATNGTINTISSASVATCSSTASDRRVTITITPAACYDAPTNLTWTKSSGTVSASKQSGPTDNGNGTYSYVYQFAQNDNGSGTFGVTCTAKAAGKTVNFDAGPGSCATTSLTETCAGSGITLPAVTASGVCKGWTTFAGWATAAVSDSTTTSGVTLYAAGDNFVPASNGQTLYAVYSKNKGGGGASTSTLTNSSIVSSGNSSGYKTYCTSGCNKSPIDGWSGKFAVNYVSSGTHYSVQLGRATTSGAGAYNTHLTSPTYASGATHISLTLSTSANQVTANGRKFYLMDTDELNYTAADQTSSYGVGTYDNSDDNYEVSFDVTGSPTQFHIYADGPAYIKTITVTYGGSTTYYCSDPNCCTALGSINGSFF